MRPNKKIPVFRVTRPYLNYMVKPRILGMECVTSEQYYNGRILQRNFMVNDNERAVSYNSFVKFRGKRFGSHNMTMLYPNRSTSKVYYKVCQFGSCYLNY